ncbi:cation acetate symporter [bacterium]|nr:cation acetate symporter [bacterium]
MIHEASWIAVLIFGLFVAFTLGISFAFAGKTKSSQGYFAAHGEVHWIVNGVAFAGDYLSAASFLGICGMIAFFGYDGFLYSIGYLAGWVVALFVIAEPIKRLGKFTFADALDSKFNSRGIKFVAAVSTLCVSIFYLIPQMVGAGVLIQPLLGFPHYAGVLIVGTVVTLIVTIAGMVSTTYVQFLKGSLLVIFSFILVVMILNRGLKVDMRHDHQNSHQLKTIGPLNESSLSKPKEMGFENSEVIENKGPWKNKPFLRILDNSSKQISYWKIEKSKTDPGYFYLYETQTVLSDIKAGTKPIVNGLPKGKGNNEGDLWPVGTISRLPGNIKETGPLWPVEFIRNIQESEIVLWGNDKIKTDDNTTITIYFPKPTEGKDILSPGNHPSFKGIRSEKFSDKLNFISLMLALFCGTASLPHILIRYYTVKSQSCARNSTVVGIATIGLFYLLTLILGLGAMTSGALDVSDSNMAAPLLARSFGEIMFAMISAIAFTTVLGTVSGLIVAASGAVVHDLLLGFLNIQMTDDAKVKTGKIACVFVGIIAIILGIIFQKMNVNYLVGWAFSVAASANLPSLVMLLFWKKTTKEGVISAVLVGMLTSLGWILSSGDTFKDVYGLPPENALVPFSQPGIVTIPLGFIILVLVSLLTSAKKPVTA